MNNTTNASGKEPDLKSQAQSSGQDLKKKAKETGTEIKNQAADLGNTATRLAKDQAADLKDTATQLASETTDKVASAFSAQKTAGADYIGSIAQAMDRAAGEFERDVPRAAKYIRKAADQIETVASAVRERDARQIVGDMQEFARREPTLFFGGAMLLGFAALRFLKSAAPEHSSGSTSSEGSTTSLNHW